MYASLTYWWGTTSPFTLTSKSYQDPKNGIPVTKLPKTIQHAVDVASRLDLVWLWVDSLCIFQDSEKRLDQ